MVGSPVKHVEDISSVANYNSFLLVSKIWYMDFSSVSALGLLSFATLFSQEVSRLIHPNRRLKWSFFITYFSSFVRLLYYLSVNFTLWLISWNHWAKFNQTWRHVSKCFAMGVQCILLRGYLIGKKRPNIF